MVFKRAHPGKGNKFPSRDRAFRCNLFRGCLKAAAYAGIREREKGFPLQSLARKILPKNPADF